MGVYNGTFINDHLQRVTTRYKTAKTSDPDWNYNNFTSQKWPPLNKDHLAKSLFPNGSYENLHQRKLPAIWYTSVLYTAIVVFTVTSVALSEPQMLNCVQFELHLNYGGA